MSDDALGPAPPIPLDKVEWRVDGKPYERDGKFSCRFVPYFDARDGMELLDEWLGPGRWKKRTTPFMLGDKPGMHCVVSVKVGDEWVDKDDVGVPTQFEPVKGSASDAFKRAAVAWGVARNVYDLPTLWAPCDTYTGGGKVQAKPNRQTLPDLLRQLKKLGFDATGGRVKDDDADDGDQTPPIAPSAPSGGANGSADAPSPNRPVCRECEKPLTEAAVREGREYHAKCEPV